MAGVTLLPDVRVAERAVTAMNKPKNALCRLCRTSSELCESHIFPRSFIKLVRDEDTNKFYQMHDKVDNLIQDGPKERLLCGECEQKISRYEKYFKEGVHLSRHGIGIVQARDSAVIRNLDYSKAKLFLLSIIWRMSVCCLPQFESISLRESEDVIRRMVMEEDPGESRMFPICALIPLIDGKVEECVLCTPSVSKHNEVYAFIIGGILYFVSVRHGNAFPDPMYLLNESGTWVMPLVDFHKVPFLGEFLARHFSSGG